jgi:hypothetical protein
MKSQKLWYVVPLCAALLAPACSDDTTPPDVGVKDGGGNDGAGPEASTPDAGAPDLPGPDMARADAAQPDAAQPDAMQPDQMQPDQLVPDQMQPDQLVPDQFVPDQFVPDQFVPDMMQPDQGTTTSKVVYFSGTGSTSQTAYQINADGTGKTAISGLPATFDVYSIYDYGQKREYGYVNRNRPQEMNTVYSYYKGIHLPNKLGKLYTYKTTSPAGYGYFVIRPDGTGKVLDFKAGSSYSTDSYYYYLGVKPDGTMFAAPIGYNSKTNFKFNLIRTDGKTFGTTGKGICDITPTTPAVYYPRYYSYVYTTKYFYFMAQDATTSGTYHLFRAPLDCSAKPSKISLANVGSTAATTVDYYGMRWSQTGGKAVFVAGTSSSNEDVMLLDEATGKVTNISESPGSYQSTGYYEWYYYYSTSGNNVVISPAGKYVAWVQYKSPNYYLYVRAADKSSKAVLITTSTNFASTAKYMANLFWANDDDLFFWAGSSYSSTMDMFHYKVSTGALANITQSGNKTKPYAGDGTMRSYNGWPSPNGKYFYFIPYHSKSGTATTSDIWYIERATGKVTQLTKNMYNYESSSNFKGVPGSSRIYYYGRPAATSSPYIEQLYTFDMDAPSTPVKLTNFSQVGTNPNFYLYDIFPMDGGKKVAFHSGYSSSRCAMYVADISGTTPVLYQLTTAGTTGSTYISDSKVFTPDGKSVVYGYSTTSYSSALDVRIQPIGSSTTPQVLQSSGYNQAILAY